MGSQDSTRYCSLRRLLKMTRTFKKFSKRNTEEETRHHEYKKKKREEEQALLRQELSQELKEKDDNLNS